MASIDIFNDDAFSVASLTAAINTVPEGQIIPNLLDPLFDEEGVTTTTISIEKENDQLFLVPAVTRGAPGAVVGGNKRQLIPFNTLHLPLTDVVRADEIQNVRAFGSDTELQTMQAVVNKRLLKLRNRIDATRAFHRFGAITGKIYDADGQTVLLDIYDRFGLNQISQAFSLANEATDVAQKIRDAKRKSEDNIGGAGVIVGWLGICGRGFYDAFVGHESVKKAFDRYNNGEFLRTDSRFKGFNFEDVVWKEYFGKVGNVEFIDKDVGYLIPLGVQDLLITRNAPADHIDTVNTIGLPFYGSQEILKHGKGVEIEAQANPISIATRPRAIIKLTK